jgi:hypothetical protein
VEQDDFFDDDNGPSTTLLNGMNHHDDDTTTTTAAMDPALAIYQTWTNWSFVDLFILILGMYMAILGIKATNENTLSMACCYLAGTCITCIGWLACNYSIRVKVDKAVAASMMDNNANNNANNNKEDMTDITTFYNTATDDMDIYNQAFQVMVLPAMVWCLCIFWAWQFQYLLSEAKHKAMEQIAAEWRQNDDDDEEELALQSNTIMSNLAATSLAVIT